MDRTFGYLSNTVNKGIILGAKGTALTVMADASYGIHRDGKSHSGVIVFMDNNMLLAKSVKQKLVVVSSTEAEMECLTEGLKQLQPIKKLLEELQLLVDNKTIIQQDNKSTMRLAKRGEGFDGKSRHMRVRYHYIAEQVSKGEIDIQYLETTKMVADLLSKPGGSSNFSELVQSIVKDMPDI
jgi:ribonuclease HI